MTIQHFFQEFFGAENVIVVQEAHFCPAKISMDFKGFHSGFKNSASVEISSDMEPEAIFSAILAAKEEGKDMSFVDEMEDDNEEEE